MIPSRSGSGCSPHGSKEGSACWGPECPESPPPFCRPQGSHGKRRLRAGLWDELAWVCLPSAPSGHLLLLRYRQAAGVWMRKGQSPQSFVVAVLGSAGGPLPTSLQVNTRQGGQLVLQKEPNQKPFLSSNTEWGGGKGQWLTPRILF